MSSPVKHDLDDSALVNVDRLSDIPAMGGDRPTISPVREKDWVSGVSSRLKASREAFGYTQEEFADMIPYGRDAYKKWENRSAIRSSYIARVCALLKISSWWLLTGHHEEKHLRGPNPPTPTTDLARPVKRRLSTRSN